MASDTLETSNPPRLPGPVGEWSASVRAFLTAETETLPPRGKLLDEPRADWTDADFQRMLWMLLMVDLSDFVGVDNERTERGRLRDLRDTAIDMFLEVASTSSVGDVESGFDALTSRLASPRTLVPRPLSEGQVVQEFVSKAPYLGWEADAHTLALAALPLHLKRAVADIQAGEYGVGFDQTHAQIYRSCLRELGLILDAAVDAAPAAGFALANSAICFSIRRRHVGAAMGQLCAFELDSVEPCRRRAAEWNDVGLPEAARRWYDVHVLADREHAEIVQRDVIPGIRSLGKKFMAQAATGISVTQAIFDLLTVDPAPASLPSSSELVAPVLVGAQS